MTDIVNDCLGLAQFLTQSLTVEQATAYLLTIEGLSLSDWKAAKALLPETAGTSNRTTVELTIKDIVVAFKNFDITTSFLVKNLGLIPGFQQESLALTSYIASSLWAVKHVSTSLLHQSTPCIVDRTTCRTRRNFLLPPLRFSTEQGGNSPNLKQKSYSGAARQPAAKKVTNPDRQRQTENQWTEGSSKSQDNNQRPQLKSLCLAVKSGPDETEESLKLVINKWNQLRDLKVEAFSRTSQNTVFRVQFTTPAAIASKWLEAPQWPSRISVKIWKGNPKTKLDPISTRLYRKKIYVGNLNAATEMSQVESNLKQIYKSEMEEDGPIATIVAYLNKDAWDKQCQRQANDLHQNIRKSACVVMTSKPGRSLSEVDLHIGDFEPRMRRWVRQWNGPIPLPEDNREGRKPYLNLKW